VLIRDIRGKNKQQSRYNKMAAIRNIIFDLGGVLLDIDFNKTKQAFEKLGVKNFDSFYTKETANPIFESLETGEISNENFYETLAHYCSPNTTHEQIQHAWNKILVAFRKPSVEYLPALKEKYNLYLLSNTNSIHHECFSKMFANEIGGQPFDSRFTKAYYSHLLQKRKPYPETYLYVLENAGIAAEETLFIDDALANIEGAAKAGLHTRLLLPDERVENISL
jgi:putative hydrolase of the HAD superfamily